MTDQENEDLINAMIDIMWPLLDDAEDVSEMKARLECAFTNAMDAWEPK